MGTGRKYQKKPMTRPIKRGNAKACRVKVQRARLIGLGVDEAVVDKMNQKEVRQTLQYPAKIKAAAE